jgi:hypothetical protein
MTEYSKILQDIEEELGPEECPTMKCQDPKPCPCRIYDTQVCDKADDVDLANVCIDFARWYYRKEGYTLGLAKLWEMVDWLKDDVFYVQYRPNEFPHRIDDYLKAQGIPERT